MKIKKIILLFILIITLTGCTYVNDLNYDEIIDMISYNPKEVNTYRNGYKFYLPNGLQITDASSNYVILSSTKYNYYLYIDLISYLAKAQSNYVINNNAYYSNTIKYNNIDGYVEINLKENNQYLIEIMYNYAKIEVMVDNEDINIALIDAINILKSIKYNATIIEKLLNDDNLDYTEEKFDIFENNSGGNSNILIHEDEEEKIEEEEEIKDTDFLNWEE